MQTRSVIFILRQGHVGEKFATRDIPEYVATEVDVTEENPVAICTLMIHVTDVMNSRRKFTFVSSAQRTFANTAQLRKLILRTFTK